MTKPSGWNRPPRPSPRRFLLSLGFLLLVPFRGFLINLRPLDLPVVPWTDHALAVARVLGEPEIVGVPASQRPAHVGVRGVLDVVLAAEFDVEPGERRFEVGASVGVGCRAHSVVSGPRRCGEAGPGRGGKSDSGLLPKRLSRPLW